MTESGKAVKYWMEQEKLFLKKMVLNYYDDINFLWNNPFQRQKVVMEAIMDFKGYSKKVPCSLQLTID